MIEKMKPMLAENANPHSRPDWLYEIKLDGQRCIGHLVGGKSVLQARSGTLITDCYPEVQIVGKHDLVVDGELICETPEGLPDFPMIARRMKQSKDLLIQHLVKTHPAKYYVFDILSVDGVSCTDKTLSERKAILCRELIPNDRVRILPWVVGKGQELFEKVCAKGYEGVMAKRLDSKYLVDYRSSAWQKIKPLRVGMFYAVGLTISDNREFRSIILARKTAKGLEYVSTVASGLDNHDIQKWFAKPAIIPHPGASVSVPVDVKVLKWIEPELIKVWYYEQTEDGHLRFPRLVPSRPRFGI